MIALVFSLRCVAMGCADIVLYIWVDGVLVRENKKLVFFFYLVEVLSRVPVAVLFHISFSKERHYWPTLVLFAVDVLLTSFLLMVSFERCR